MSPVLDEMRFKPEQATLQEILTQFNLEPVITDFEQRGGLKSRRDYWLGNALRLSPVLSPRLFGLLGDVRQRVQYEEPIDLFVTGDPSINALAVYSLDKTPHIIVLTSSMIERMNDDELRFVLGHEIGHIQYQHYRALTVYEAQTDREGNLHMPRLLQRRLGRWRRLSELSADRAGFAAQGGELEPIVSAFFKLETRLGPEHLKFDLSAFLQQVEELRQLKGRESICGFSHPITPIRVRALQLFRDARGGAGSVNDLVRVDQKVTELLKLMDYEVTEPLQVSARDFVLAGGLVVACADKTGIKPTDPPVSEEERRMLVDLLMPFTADPEEALAKVESLGQAQTLLNESAEWLRENAGEERYELFRRLAGIASVDGVLQGAEEECLVRIAEQMGIPAKVAKQIIYEVLSYFLQAQRSSGPKGFSFKE